MPRVSLRNSVPLILGGITAFNQFGWSKRSKAPFTTVLFNSQLIVCFCGFSLLFWHYNYNFARLLRWWVSSLKYGPQQLHHLYYKITMFSTMDQHSYYMFSCWTRLTSAKKNILMRMSAPTVALQVSTKKWMDFSLQLFSVFYSHVGVTLVETPPEPNVWRTQVMGMFNLAAMAKRQMPTLFHVHTESQRTWIQKQLHVNA